MNNKIEGNINLLVLKSFFDKGSVWLDEIELLQDDYSILTRKLLSIEIENGKLPSLSLTLKNIDKLNFNIEEEIAYKKKAKAILISVDNIETDLNEEELLELLREDYLARNLQAELPTLTQYIIDKNFEKAKNSIFKLEQTLESGMAKDMTFENNEELFLDTDSVLNFKNIGFPKELSFSRLPEGSMLLITSRSKTGKTSLLVGSITENFINGNNIYLASYEIPRVSVINRMLSYISDVPLQEINEGVYSVSDSSLRVLVARYVLSKNVDFKTASRIFLEKGEEGLKELPTRENKLIIKASLTKDELERYKAKNKRPPNLPSDTEILKDVRAYNKVGKLDFIYIDYISLIPFVDSKNSREQNIANFSKALKLSLLETSTIGIVLSQSKSSQEFYMPLYSQAITLDCDASISIQPTKEQNENGLTTIHLYVARHTEGYISYECEKHLDVQKFIPTGNSIGLEDFLEKYNKENKGKDKK